MTRDEPRDNGCTHGIAYAPEDSPQVTASVVEQVDTLAQQARGFGWQTSYPGDRRVRQASRRILNKNGLPIEGEIFDNAYNYIRENY